MILLHKLGRPATMDDSVDVSQLPDDAQVVGGYIDGRYANLPALIRRFHGRADIVSFGIFLGHLADFTDVEPGNPIDTPRKVRADFEFRRAHGVWKPGFYGDRTRMANTILPGLSGIPRSEYRLLLADWTDRPHITPGYDGDQYESLNHPNIDISRLASSFFPPGSINHPHRLPHPSTHRIPSPIRKLSHPAHLIPTGGGIGVGVDAILKASGVHLTSAEAGGIAAILAAIAGYLSHYKARS